MPGRLKPIGTPCLINLRRGNDEQVGSTQCCDGSPARGKRNRARRNSEWTPGATGSIWASRQSRSSKLRLVDETCHLDNDNSGDLAAGNPNARAAIDWAEDQWRRERQAKRLLGLHEQVHVDGTGSTDLCTDAAGVRIGLLEDLDPFDNAIEIGQDEARDGERALCRTDRKRGSCVAAKRIQLSLERLAGHDALNRRRRLHLFVLSCCWFGDREAANGDNAQQEKRLLDLHSLLSFLVRGISDIRSCRGRAICVGSHLRITP